jgi:acetyl-CoA synthetase
MITTELLLENDAIIIPSNHFKADANVQSTELYKEARCEREKFWEKQALCLSWFRKWDQTLQGDFPYPKWYVGGKLNASYNCLDRHIAELGSKIAILWEGERGETKSLTYNHLFQEVQKFSNALKALGIKKGDRIAIYMPMIPEAIVAVLSCARIGAVHTVVFGGFSADALKDRINDAKARIVITADGGLRKGKIVPLKESTDLAVEFCPSIEKIIVVKHSNQPIFMNQERDVWYHDLINNAESSCPAEEMDAEDLLFILYTSGTTGKPKGIVHTTGGYMVGTTMSTRWVLDIKSTDVYWCTADIGWITGHSYVIYGPLSNGATILMYEGAPDWPKQDRYWKLIEKYKVTIFYTAPTAVRTFMKWGEEWLCGRDLSSLRLLGSVGEPINPEAWVWYYRHIGQEKCPIVDTWWQTETGSIMIAPLPGITPLKPGSATQPLPGIEMKVVDEQGNESNSGYLVAVSPWPSMLRGVYNDPSRYECTYWKKFKNQYYFTGDGAKLDQEGYFWLMGRVDDVINVSGHCLGTMELESVLTEYSGVVEAAIIAIPHPIKGQAIIGFVTLRDNHSPGKAIEDAIKQHVAKRIGAIARPEKIIFLGELPKTRSGKIIRRLLRDIAEGKVVGDVTTLANPSVIQMIKEQYSEDDQ